MLALHTIKSKQGSRKKRKRVGRGNASGHGTYSTRGQKGQRARSGGTNKLKYKGMRKFIQKVPKTRGFHSNRVARLNVNIGELNAAFNDGDKVTPLILLQKKLIKSLVPGVKILSDGELTKKLTVQAQGFSKSAVEKITKAGGSVEVIQ